MRKLVIAFVFSCLMLPIVASAQNKPLPEVKIDKIPTSVEGYIEMRNKTAVTPQGGAAAFIVALMMYTHDKELGMKCITIALDRGALEAGNVYKGFKPTRTNSYLIKQLDSKAHVPFSYVIGTSPEKGYVLPKGPMVFRLHTNPYSGDASEGVLKMFVQCSGASTARPVKMKKNNRGIWKAAEWSSLAVGTKAPAKNIDDDL